MSAPEFDGQSMTKREVLIAREVCARSRCAMAHQTSRSYTNVVACADCCDVAIERYPLPKVKRPRVIVQEPCGMGWRFVNGQIEYRLWAGNAEEPWKNAAQEGTHEITVPMVALWADLIANPTEEVEA